MASFLGGGLFDELLGGPTDNAAAAADDPSLAFSDPEVVGRMTAPSARLTPTVPPAIAYPQYHETPSPVSLLMGQPGDSWKKTLVRSLVAGLGSFAAARAGLDPLAISNIAGERVRQRDLQDYKMRLANANMLRQQQEDEDARQLREQQRTLQRFNLANQIQTHIEGMASTGEIQRYKDFARKFVGPLGIDVDQFPTLPSVGALMKIRKGYQDTFDGIYDRMQKRGINVNDHSLYDENNPNAPTVDVMGPNGPGRMKFGTLAKLAYGDDYDPSKLPQKLPEFGGKERARADAKAKELYGPKADYTALKDDDWKQLAHEQALATHITVQGAGGTGAGSAGSDLDSNAEAVVEGRAVPSMLSKNKGYINALMARADKLSRQRSGKPLNFLQLESSWLAAKRWGQTMNGPQMTRFQGLAGSVINTLDDVQRLGDLLQQGSVKRWNAAKRSTLTEAFGNTPYSQLANQYVTAVNTLKEEFANLAAGGYAPTEAAWKLANDQVNGDFGVKDLHASLDELKRLISFRVNAQFDVRPVSAYDQPPTFNPTETPAQQRAVSAPTAPVKPPKYAVGDPVASGGKWYRVTGIKPDGSNGSVGAFNARAEAQAR